MRVGHTLARIVGAAILSCSAAIGGCSAPPEPARDGSADALAAAGTLRLGTGTREFTAIEDGDLLLIAEGCQGSQHVSIALRSEDMDPLGMVVELSVERAEDALLVSSPFRLRLSFTPDATGTSAQLTDLMLQIPDPDLAIGHDLVLRGRIEDRDGVAASAERRVRVEWGSEGCSSPPG